MKILMVCLGNICRSPLAEAILRKKCEEAGLNWEIDSAGTNGYHIGEAPHHLTQKIAKARHLDISNLRARKFLATDMDQYDKIYVMAEDVMDEVKQISGKHFKAGKTDYFLNELYPGTNQDVFDPWYGGYEDFVKVYELIDNTCNAILENYDSTIQSIKAQVK